MKIVNIISLDSRGIHQKCVNVLQYLFYFSQVHINEITRVIRVPLFLVLLHLLSQEIHDLPVVAKNSLVRSWQVMQQAREGIVQLVMGQTIRSVTDSVCFVIKT